MKNESKIKSRSKSKNPIPNLLLLLLLLLLISPSSSTAANWYASTNGLVGAAGTIGAPLDLQTAFNKVGIIIGGDTLYLRGGNYTHAPQGTTPSDPGFVFQIIIAGNSNAPITIRSYPGEIARLDGGAVPWVNATLRPTLLVGSVGTGPGSYTIIRDLEIYSSSTETRLSFEPDASGSAPTDLQRSDGIIVQAPYVKLINNVIHDLTTGISSFSDWSWGEEFYGNVVFNNGFMGTPHRHGHNMYLQGPITVPANAKKLVKRNLSTAAYDKGVQCYGSGTSFEGHYWFHENMWLGAGDAAHGNVLLGMRNGNTADRYVDGQFLNNFGYNCDWAIYFQQDPIAYLDLLCTGNYFWRVYLQASSWKQLTFTNNYLINTTPGRIVISFATNSVGGILPWTFDNNRYTVNPSSGTNMWVINGSGFMNFPTYKSTMGYDLNSTISHTQPNTNYVVLQDNAYDVNRGHALIYNYTAITNVVLNVVPLGWASGDAVTIRNLQNYYGDTAMQTVSAGRTLNLDMRAASHSLAIPYGDTVPLAPSSFPEFGAFILERTSTNPPVLITHTITVQSSNPSSGVGVTISPADNNGASSGATSFSRLYTEGALVNFTADAISPVSGTFSKWQYNGVDFSAVAAITVTNSANATLTAFYISPPPPPPVDYRRPALRRRVL